MNTHQFAIRHLGISGQAVDSLSQELGYANLDELITAAVPETIRSPKPLDLPLPATEQEALAELRSIMGKNVVQRSFIGQGYYGTFTPPVIQRNILENPGWYTAYTPYQAEISQGRMEALINFQTMIAELTALPVANASLLDEGTAVAEAAALCHASAKVKNPRALFVDERIFPQSRQVLETRMEAIGIQISLGRADAISTESDAGIFAAVIQYPAADGSITDWRSTISALQAKGIMVILACDLLSLTLITPPGELGADVAVGNSQRFGVPFGFGGPHAAFMACKDELKRKLPGRIIGVSIDSQGKPAYRLSLQTREQHIRREKATSNICTAQVLLAVMAGMYAVWHGPEGLKEIATNVHGQASRLASALRQSGVEVCHENFFDTLTVRVVGEAENIVQQAAEAGYNVRHIDQDHVGISCDETTTTADLQAILAFLAPAAILPATSPSAIPATLQRQSSFLKQEVFHLYRTEHEMLRYLHRLEQRDLALNESMIALLQAILH